MFWIKIVAEREAPELDTLFNTWRPIKPHFNQWMVKAQKTEILKTE